MTSDYEAKGSEVEFDGVTGYEMECPKATKKAIMILHDIFGPDSGRTKKICDDYAAEGYLVLMPYVFDPTRFDEKKDSFLKYFLIPRFLSWIHKHAWPVVGPKYDKALTYLKAKGITSVGLVGFCWGAFPMTHLLADPKYSDLLNGGCCFHPSMMIFSILFDWSYKSYHQSCTKPLAYLPAGNDAADVKPNGTVDDIMKQANPSYSKCHFEEYATMKHGWVNKGDLGDDAVSKEVQRALTFSYTFFNDIL